MRFARRFGIVNQPNPIVPQHTRPVAYLGGVGIALGIGATAVILAWLSPGRAVEIPASIALGGPMFLAIGLVDDLRPFRPLAKLLCQGAAATGVVAATGPAPLIGAPLVDGALAVVWIVVVVNALNVTDVCDGLAGGLAAVSLVGLAAFGTGASPFAWIAAGAVVGFLVLNSPPAKIFLGDAGSHLLGFLLADLTLRYASVSGAISAPLVMLLVVVVPLFEVALIVARRVRQGIPWWRGSPDHFALLLQAAGLSKWRVDLIAWGAAMLGCTGAWIMVADPWPLGAVTGVVVSSLVVAAWRALARWKVVRVDRERGA
jgi:UDP-GlcNAc:undecaprenyl-phosphate GlcNAc-1-phosphate transferase